MKSMGWYVVFVETGYEDVFCHYIDKVKKYMDKEVKYKLLVPKRVIYERKNGVQQKVIRTMFPGYVLINTNQIVDFFLLAKNGPHVIRFIKQGRCFLEVTEDEINRILLLVNSKGVIEVSKVYTENDKVTIIEGPLLGMEGIIKKIDKRKGRAKVSLSINERTMLIDLGIEIIRKA